MDPLSMGLITGGANLVGSIFSANTSANNMDKQQQMQLQSQQFNAEQAQINRDYQTQMSNTAYQRASQDMQKAGLNPMMMFGSGGAASSPSGSAASTGTTSLPGRTSPMAGLGDAVSKAVSSAISLKTFDKMTEEIANLQSQGAKIAAETATEKERPQLLRESTLETANRAQRLGNLMPVARLAGKSAEDIEALPDWLRQSLNIGGYAGGKIGDTLAPILSSATGFRRLLSSPDNPTKKFSGLGPSGTQTVKEMIDDAISSLER